MPLAFSLKKRTSRLLIILVLALFSLGCLLFIGATGQAGKPPSSQGTAESTRTELWQSEWQRLNLAALPRFQGAENDIASPYGKMLRMADVPSEPTVQLQMTDEVRNENRMAGEPPEDDAKVTVAIAPSSPNIVYVGTGSEHSSGIGLLKSTDGGNTWQFPNSVIAGRFWRISVHPTNQLELVAATDRGGLRSIDGGQTWSTVLTTSQTFNWVEDLKRDPVNPMILYAARDDEWLPRRRHVQVNKRRRNMDTEKRRLAGESVYLVDRIQTTIRAVSPLKQSGCSSGRYPLFQRELLKITGGGGVTGHIWDLRDLVCNSY